MLLIIVTYWVTEPIPIAVTSLLPLILFPLLAVLKASQVAPDYFQVSYFLSNQQGLIGILVKYN